MNDLNILDCSQLFWPKQKPKLMIAKRFIDWFCWVADGIYPLFRIFLETILFLTTGMEETFARAQEAFQKGVKRTFGVLFSRWQILSNPSPLWHRSDMNDVVRACIIVHNMFVEYRNQDGGMGTKNIVSLYP